MTGVSKLESILSDQPAIEVDKTTDFGKKVLTGLMEAWSYLKGSDAEATTSKKLDRAENLSWTPPKLTFILERHGRTVNGSSRASLHHWSVDLSSRTATIEKVGHRQLSMQSKRLDCTALAQDVYEQVSAGVDTEYLIWSDAKKTVVIRIGLLIPEAKPQTTQERRKRFRKALEPLMTEQGWRQASRNTELRFERVS
jgi:hypothetical protein